jgi:hypothetical protein
METSQSTIPDQRPGETATRLADSEWNAVGLRPIAHWVRMPTADGGNRLAMVWAVPDPMPSSAGA